MAKAKKKAETKRILFIVILGIAIAALLVNRFAHLIHK
jgi:hypothetical protein